METRTSFIASTQGEWAIPDNTPEGVIVPLQMDVKVVIESIKVHVVIEHSFTGDLKVNLNAPSGKSVTLHNRGGGANDNIEKTFEGEVLDTFIGDEINGEWQLQAIDFAPRDNGSVKSWSIEANCTIVHTATPQAIEGIVAETEEAVEGIVAEAEEAVEVASETEETVEGIVAETEETVEGIVAETEEAVEVVAETEEAVEEAAETEEAVEVVAETEEAVEVVAETEEAVEEAAETEEAVEVVAETEEAVEVAETEEAVEVVAETEEAVEVAAETEEAVEVAAETEEAVETEETVELVAETEEAVEVVAETEETVGVAAQMVAEDITDEAAEETITPDDLKKIEGIGPKIEELLNNAGIFTFAQLAETEVEDIQDILDEAGPAYNRHDPGTWAEQAELAANEEWEELKTWQDELVGGKVVEE